MSVEVPWVVNQGCHKIYFNCFCDTLIEMGPRKPPLDLYHKNIIMAVGSSDSAIEDYLVEGQVIRCPKCHTQFEVTGIRADTDEGTSGVFEATFGPTSHALSPVQARVRMLWEDE